MPLACAAGRPCCLPATGRLRTQSAEVPRCSYLRALGVLPLVAEQEDPDARAWWDRGGWLCLESNLDETGLVAFFEKRYRPTPILAPWNGGSGFYPKDRKAGIEAIANSADARFQLYRQVITFARQIPEVIAGKSEAKAEEARCTAIQLDSIFWRAVRD
jgi:CRISPR-associated protein Csx17